MKSDVKVKAIRNNSNMPSVRQSVIVTHNRLDFGELAQKYFAESQTHYGIIISVQRLPHEIAERLLKILNDFTADEMTNQIIYI